MEPKKQVKGKKANAKSDSLDIYTLQENNPDHSITYKYTTFDELIEQGEYNFYGIIYDASFPLEEENTGKYSCVLKLIDQTTNCLTNPNDFSENIINLIIKSNERENIPFVHYIGDIISLFFFEQVHHQFKTSIEDGPTNAFLVFDSDKVELAGFELLGEFVQNRLHLGFAFASGDEEVVRFVLDSAEVDELHVLGAKFKKDTCTKLNGFRKILVICCCHFVLPDRVLLFVENLFRCALRHRPWHFCSITRGRSLSLV